MKKPIHIKTESDPWESLRTFTAARIALGRTGAALPLNETLALKMAHAHARDAVYSVLDKDGLVAAFQSVGLAMIQLHSNASDRPEYLQRPDKGRTVIQSDLDKLGAEVAGPVDIAIILADGLSATAINKHAFPVLKRLLPVLLEAGYRISPILSVEQARVAVGDSIGFAVRAKISLVFIGERPGLSSPDSMGLYLTYNPSPGLTDEARNCVSNIRPEGLDYQAAADKIFWLVQSALTRGLSGIDLKDDGPLLR